MSDVGGGIGVRGRVHRGWGKAGWASMRQVRGRVMHAAAAGHDSSWGMQRLFGHVVNIPLVYTGRKDRPSPALKG